MPISRTMSALAAIGAVATLGACAEERYTRGYGSALDDESGVVSDAVRPTRDNPTGSVYVDGDGNTYRCEEGLIFSC